MSTPAEYPATPRTVPTRLGDRARFEAEEVHAVLDEALICHVGTVVDGEPVVLPTIHARVGRRLYLHGSTGARISRLAAAAEPDGGLPVCVTVTLLDGLVLARSQFHHSMNYRSVVVRGRARVVTDPAERELALTAVVDHVITGRSRESRPGSPRELAATAVLRVELAEATLKRRAGGPSDDAEDLLGGHWAGVIPVTTVFGEPVPAPELPPGTPIPPHVMARVSAGHGSVE